MDLVHEARLCLDVYNTNRMEFCLFPRYLSCIDQGSLSWFRPLVKNLRIAP